MRLPSNLFIACFFCLTLSLAHATEQVNDNFVYKGKTYFITGGRIPLDFNKWGLRPVAMSTACWRGYIASFALVGDKLVLTDLVVNISAREDAVVPTINDVSPTDRTSEASRSHFIRLAYNNINLPLDFTGPAYLKDGRLIRGMYGRFDDAAGFETVIELVFENGALKSERDISQKMAEMRMNAGRIGTMRRNVEIIKDFISEGGDVNMECFRGTTLLHVAIENENLEMVIFLISKGADVRWRHWRTDRTLLHSAVEKNNVYIVRLLVTLGLDVNAKDTGDYTPLHIAARNPNATIVEFLVAQGADVNAKCNHSLVPTPLHWAVISNSNVKVIELLVSKGADVDAKDENGSTMLHHAGMNRNVAIAEFLVFKGADVHAKDKDGSTPLHRVVRNLAFAEFLVSKGADVRAKNNNGSTPLHAASLGGFSDSKNAAAVVQFLVEQGADVNAKDNDGNTPLHLAVRFGSNTDVVLFLISQGADVRAKNQEGKTPLDVAHPEYTRHLSGQ